MNNCALCGIESDNFPFVESDRHFCCAGCHAVFNILSIKSELDKSREHPLFKEALKAGLISNPALLEELRVKEALLNEGKTEELESEKLHITIEGLWCPSCSEVIKYILLQNPGVSRCVVDYATDLGYIEYNPRSISKSEIFTAIRQIGYHPLPLEDASQTAVSKSLYLRCMVSSFFALNVMMLAYPLYATFFDVTGQEIAPLFAWLSLFSAIPVLTYGAWPIYLRFFAGLRTGFFGMETLVVMGVGSATILSLYELWNGKLDVYFDTAAVIVALVLVGKVVESKAKFSAKKTLLFLSRSQPKRARKVFSDNSKQFVPIKDIKIDDIIQVLAGEKIVLDGIVVDGEGTADESLMTGEAIPLVKECDSKVLGGSILLHGNLTIKVTTKLEDSVQQKILFLVKQDIEKKGDQESLIEKLTKMFVPFVLLIAFSTWFLAPVDSTTVEKATRALSVLLIACPCAIGIAIPLAEAKLIQCLADSGVLVRNRAVLPFLGKESVYLFDKTGTVTTGVFEVKSGLGHIPKPILAKIKSVAGLSIHPIARAIVKAININHELDLDVKVSGKEYAGQGIEGYIDESHIELGSKKYLLSKKIIVPSLMQSENEGLSSCYIALDKQFLTKVSLGDTIRPEAVKALQELAPVPSVLVSGDNQDSVREVAKICGFSAWHAECSPLGKREIVQQYKKGKQIVAMVGDGINDAPALTAADIAISVLSATDISIQVSDLLLTTENIAVIGPIRKMAALCRKIIFQNIFWAFFYNIIGIGLAMMGLLSPIYSAFAMVASSLFVIANAQRVR